MTARFPLLPDECPAEYAEFREGIFASLPARDAAERHEVERIVQAMWREGRAERLEALILTDLFAADRIADKAEARAAREAATRALGVLLRYRARVERDRERALLAFYDLRRRPKPAATPASTNEPSAPTAASPAPARTNEPGRPAPVMPSGTNEPGRQPPPAAPARSGTSEPSPARPMNRHERRRLAALERKMARKAA